MSSSIRIDKRKKYILILGKGPKQRLEHTLSVEKIYSINFTENNKKFFLSLHDNGANSYLFINGTDIIEFKAKVSEIAATPLCLGDISKEISVNNLGKTGINGYVYDFSTDYNATTIDDIHKLIFIRHSQVFKEKN